MPALNEGYRYDCGDWDENVPAQERHQSLECRRLSVWNDPPQEIVATMRSLGANISGSFIYKPGDFQGWHTNGNVLGQRVYISWAEQSHMSGMRFYVDNQYIDSPDERGWNLRAFTPPVWHSVYARCMRASVGFRFCPSSPLGDDVFQPISMSKYEDINAVVEGLRQ
jgi:hypothetical protein